jgi:hypothetical protein
MCGYIAKQMGFEVRPYPADWKGMGKSAGPRRNRKMYDTEQPGLVMAFHNDLMASKGTKDMVVYAADNGCEVKLFKESEGDDQQRGTDPGASTVADGLPEVGPTV